MPSAEAGRRACALEELEETKERERQLCSLRLARKVAVMKWLERVKNTKETFSLKMDDKNWVLLNNASMTGILSLAELVSLEEGLGRQGEGYHEVFSAVSGKLKEIGWI